MDAYASRPAFVKLRLIFIFSLGPRSLSCLSHSGLLPLPQSGRHSVQPREETAEPVPCKKLHACTTLSFLEGRSCSNAVPVNLHHMLWPPNRLTQLAAFPRGSSTGNPKKFCSLQASVQRVPSWVGMRRHGLAIPSIEIRRLRCQANDSREVPNECRRHLRRSVLLSCAGRRTEIRAVG